MKRLLFIFALLVAPIAYAGGWEYANYVSGTRPDINFVYFPAGRIEGPSLPELISKLSSGTKSGRTHTELFNVLGAQGWELVQCEDVSLSPSPMTQCYFKRSSDHTTGLSVSPSF